MVLNDPLANALSKVLNAEKISKKEILVKPISKVIKKILEIMNEQGYVGAATEVADGRGNHFILNLLNKINKCGVIKPRHSVTRETYEKFEKRYLPAKGFGILIVSTSKGMMTHEEAKEKNIGGKNEKSNN